MPTGRVKSLATRPAALAMPCRVRRFRRDAATRRDRPKPRAVGPSADACPSIAGKAGGPSNATVEGMTGPARWTSETDEADDLWRPGAPSLSGAAPVLAPGRRSRVVTSAMFAAVFIAGSLIFRIARDAIESGNHNELRRAFLLSLIIVAVMVTAAVIVRRVRWRLLSPEDAAATARWEATAGQQRRRETTLHVIVLLGATMAILIAWRVVYAGTTSTLGLAVGQCFDSGGRRTGLDRVPVVDCSGPHELQIVAQLEYPAPAGAPFPGMEAQWAWAEPRCIDGYRQFTGRAFDRDGPLRIGKFAPQEVYWVQDVRVIWCTVGSRDGSLLLGSAAR